MDTIGQTHKFKVPSYNFTAKRQTINVTKGVCPSVLPLIRVVAAALSDAVVEIAHALGAVQVCNTAIGGARSTWSSAETSASSIESDVQEKAKYETSLNQPQSTNPNHGFLMEPLSIFIEVVTFFHKIYLWFLFVFHLFFFFETLLSSTFFFAFFQLQKVW